jgi:hypothetical protein
VCKQNKKTRINKKIKHIEEAHKESNARKFFNDIKSFQGEKLIGVLAHRDEDGLLIFEQERMLERRKQFLSTLMKIGARIA